MQYRHKHVTVVEEDIDPSSYERLDWAFAHRANAWEDGIVIFPGPSTRARRRTTAT